MHDAWGFTISLHLHDTSQINIIGGNITNSFRDDDIFCWLVGLISQINTALV